MYLAQKPAGEQESKQKVKPRVKATRYVDLLEWHVYEDEERWQESPEMRAEVRPEVRADGPLQASLPAAVPSAWQRWWFVLVAVTLGALVWAVAWVQARQGLATVEAEVQGAVAVDAWLSDHATDFARFSAIGAENRESDVQGMEILALGDGWARVRVIVQGAGGGSAFRQTRVYQQEGTGWQRVESHSLVGTHNQWGRAQELESRYFIFRYFAQDEEAVTASAPVLDALYPIFTAATQSGAPESAKMGSKIVVVVDPTRTFEETFEVGALDGSLTLPSPSATLVPIEVTEEAILVQGVALALFDQLAAQSDALNDLPAEWQPLRAALRLWLLWDQGLPLARWREPLARWVFWEDGGAGGGATIPAFVPAFCADHSLWMHDMAAMELPVRCFSRPDGGEGILALRYPVPPPLALPTIGQENGRSSASSLPTLSAATRPPLPSAAVVVYATFFEYISATYGSGERGATQVRAVLTMMPDYENWETLLPALFGLSQDEFERGWNEYLRQQYGVGR